MRCGGRQPNTTGFAIHGNQVVDPVLGRLVERGLHDELAGTAYAIVDGVDGGRSRQLGGRHTKSPNSEAKSPAGI
jgi:type IV secretory pathway VirD2 relaxase